MVLDYSFLMIQINRICKIVDRERVFTRPGTVDQRGRCTENEPIISRSSFSVCIGI